MPRARKWRPIENFCVLAGICAMYEDGENETRVQEQVCAVTYTKIIDDLVNETTTTLPSDVEYPWPLWPSVNDREYVSAEEAKKRAENRSNLRDQGHKVLRECRKLEATLDNLRRDYGGMFPSGWTRQDKLHHVAEVLWNEKEELRLAAISVDGPSSEGSSVDVGQLANQVVAEQAGIHDMPDDFMNSHQYFLAWSYFGSLGVGWMNLAPPSTGDGPQTSRHVEPLALKSDDGNSEKENMFPKNPSPKKCNTSRSAHRKKKMEQYVHGAGDDDNSSDGQVGTLEMLQHDLHEFVKVKKFNQRLKAAERLYQLQPTDVNKRNYMELLEEASSAGP